LDSVPRNDELIHVVEGMGLEGSTDYPYTNVEGTDFALNLAIPDVDFGTLHLYTTDCRFAYLVPCLCPVLTRIIKGA
jgi:hypothetical protein